MNLIKAGLAVSITKKLANQYIYWPANLLVTFITKLAFIRFTNKIYSLNIYLSYFVT